MSTKQSHIRLLLVPLYPFIIVTEQIVADKGVGSLCCQANVLASIPVKKDRAFWLIILVGLKRMVE